MDFDGDFIEKEIYKYIYHHVYINYLHLYSVDL